jgi:hypothetical protein
LLALIRLVYICRQKLNDMIETQPRPVGRPRSEPTTQISFRIRTVDVKEIKEIILNFKNRKRNG